MSQLLEHGLRQLKGKGYEIFYGKAFWAQFKDRLGCKLGYLGLAPALLFCLLLDKWFKGVAKGLAALAEGCLYDGLEGGLVAAKARAAAAPKANYCRLNLRRGSKATGTHGKQVLDVVPGLQKNGQNTVSLAAWALCDALCNLFLHHADNLRNSLAVIQNLEENLRRNIIREVTDYIEVSLEKYIWINLQEISQKHAAVSLREVREQVVNALCVNLYGLDVQVFTLPQILGKYAHARANLQDVSGAVQCIYDCAGYTLVCKEMLTKRFFCSNFHKFRLFCCKYTFFIAIY